MRKGERDLIKRLYTAITTGKTVLGFDEKRGVGIISVVDERRDDTTLMPAAEIQGPFVMPGAIPE